MKSIYIHDDFVNFDFNIVDVDASRKLKFCEIHTFPESFHFIRTQSFRWLNVKIGLKTKQKVY
jgi:hypothetical protein